MRAIFDAGGLVAFARQRLAGGRRPTA